MLRADILTLFPAMLAPVLEASILGRAQRAGALEVGLHDIRDAATGVHRAVDDAPYGGGAGMVLRVDVMAEALARVMMRPEVQAVPAVRRRIVLLTPQGMRLTQPVAAAAAADYDQLTLVCGHYEGFDERIRGLVDVELSIGDFVLTGGELPALVFLDAVARLRPEVLSKGSAEEESHTLTDGQGRPLLEYPHFTRPAEWRGQSVPEVLLSGDHARIAAWRLRMAVARTEARREAVGTI